MAQPNPVIGWMKPTERNTDHPAFSVLSVSSEYEYHIEGRKADGEPFYCLKDYWYFEPTIQKDNQYGKNINDPVNNPSHYQLLPGVEVIDVLDVLCNKLDKSESLVLTGSQKSYYAQMMGYLMRCMDKNGLQDMKKARFYLDRIIKQRGGDSDE